MAEMTPEDARSLLDAGRGALLTPEQRRAAAPCPLRQEEERMTALARKREADLAWIRENLHKYVKRKER